MSVKKVTYEELTDLFDQIISLQDMIDMVESKLGITVELLEAE